MFGIPKFSELSLDASLTTSAATSSNQPLAFSTDYGLALSQPQCRSSSSNAAAFADMPELSYFTVNNSAAEFSPVWTNVGLTESRYELLQPDDPRLRGVSAAPPGSVYVIDRDGLKGTPWENTPSAKLPRLISEEDYNNPDRKTVVVDHPLLVPGMVVIDASQGGLPEDFGDTRKMKTTYEEKVTKIDEPFTIVFDSIQLASARLASAQLATDVSFTSDHANTSQRFELLQPSDPRLKGVSAAPPGSVYVIDRDGLKGTPWENTPSAKLPRLITEDQYKNPDREAVGVDSPLRVPGIEIIDVSTGKIPEGFGDTRKMTTTHEEKVTKIEEPFILLDSEIEPLV